MTIRGLSVLGVNVVMRAPANNHEARRPESTLPAPGSALADLSPAFQAETRGIYNWSSATSSVGYAASLTEQRPLYDPPDDDDYAEGFAQKYGLAREAQ